MYDKLIFEIKDKDICEKSNFSETYEIDKKYLRNFLDLPNLSEVDVVRHYTNLSLKNYGVDQGLYPLGSCTMKYNPKINEVVASLPNFTCLHPLQPTSTAQGALKIYYETSKMLSSLTGMSEFSFNPFAGAHGEAVGLMIIKEYFLSKKDFKRTKVIIPDSAHGTNPASCNVVGFETVEIKSNDKGLVDLESLKNVLNDEVAAIMLTNPNTVGIFEKDILEISKLVHANGSLLYYDGANLNAILGVARPADMGFDVMHFNIHKTFSTPHGGGGPGAGPVGVKKILEPFLPVPRIEKEGEKYLLNGDYPDSIGKLRSFYGNYGVLLRAYAYIRSMGPDGLRESSEHAVLNANYLMNLLKDEYDLPHDLTCMHEFVLAGLKNPGDATTLDVAKRLLDYGFHPPTVYFPLIVREALMIEPTESESLQTLESFATAMKSIAKEAIESPELLKTAPSTTPTGRIDEVFAARSVILTYDDLLAFEEKQRE